MLTFTSRMILISTICLTVAHPGIYMPTISSRNRPVTAEEKAEAGEKSSMSSRQGGDLATPQSS